MIFQMTYFSDGLKVKGYLGLPKQYALSAGDLQTLAERHYGTNDLPLTEMAVSLHPDKRPIHSFKLPVFVYCRGGIGNVGRVRMHWMEQFANIGQHIVFAPTYRGGDGGEGRDEFGGSDKEDVLAALRLLRDLPFVDAERISVMGFSRGSINATLAAADNTDVHRLVLWSGVSDLAETYEERIDMRRMLKRVIGGTPTKYPEAYQARSPLYMAERIRCPVLIMHGTEDHQVALSHGLNMYDKLKSLGSIVDMHRYAGLAHHFPAHIHEAAIDRMFDWIRSAPEKK